MAIKLPPVFTLVGTGFISPRHIEAIYAVGGKIADVVNTGYGQDLWKHTVKTTYAPYVIILTPNDLHVPIAKHALAAGKTVLCEKPLGIGTDEVQSLIETERLSKGKVFTVLQLRHHPLVKKLKREINPENDYEITMDISVYRDEKYYLGWKGNDKRSGGILFNLGSHYFDLLTHLFGVPDKITAVAGNEKTMEGILEGKNFLCNWRISTAASRSDQRRVFEFNGESCNFSSKDNLSYENLHQYVYEDLIQGKGITPNEVLPSIFLIEGIYDAFKNGGI